MNTLTIDIRRAEPQDAAAIADVHLEAWRGAYSGIIPHKTLTGMINRRGTDWWANAIRRAATVLVVEIGGVIAGYATVGRNRARDDAAVQALLADDWRVIVVWECDLRRPDFAPALIAEVTGQAASDLA